MGRWLNTSRWCVTAPVLGLALATSVVPPMSASASKAALPRLGRVAPAWPAPLVLPGAPGAGGSLGPAFQIAAVLPLSVNQTAPLRLGAVAAPASGVASLTVDPASNTRTYDSVGGLLSGSAFSRATFTIAGGPLLSATYAVTLPPPLTLGGATLHYTFYSVNANSTTGGRMDATGRDTLYVGGTLTVPSSATAGTQTANAGAVTATAAVGLDIYQGSDDLDNLTWTIAQPLRLQKTADLNFGDVVAGAIAGSVAISTTGARTQAGGALLGNGVGVSEARFSLMGEPNTAFSLTVDPAAQSISSGTNAMTVDAWQVSPASPAVLPATLPATVRVGATLHVGAAQPPGNYSGIFNITANYQ